MGYYKKIMQDKEDNAKKNMTSEEWDKFFRRFKVEKRAKDK